MSDKIPKKRGRKTKKQSEPEISIPKKRGRKPKNKDVECKKTTTYKKRGRKPKLNISTVVKTQISDEPIILHIPIKNNNLKLNIEDGIKDKSYEPIPFDNNNIYTTLNKYVENANSSNVNNVNNVNNVKNVENVENVKNVENVENVKNGENVENVENGENINNKNIINEFNKLCNIYKSDITIKRNKVEKIFINYDVANNNKTWPTHTNISCLWCCHDFSNFPFGIPIKITESNIKMFGNFCSPECAGAYIFDSIKELNKWEYYSLLNYVYKKNKDIKLAPPRISLKKFGGKLDIEEFRLTNTIYDKTYKIHMPPMISVIPLLEEVNINNDFSNISSNIESNMDNLILKRTKPLPDSENTLENCMNLKCV